jgi:hypothetical protein
MEMPRLNKSVRRVVKLQPDEDGKFVPTVIYKGGSRKRKVSSGLKPIESTVRKLAKSHVKIADTYLKKHTRSNEKRKDGWLKDFVANVTNAGTKGRKTLGKNSMRWPTLLKMN